MMIGEHLTADTVTQASGRSPLDERFASVLLHYRTVFAALSLLLIVGAGLGITRVERDPSVDAFVPDDHPAALARDRAQDLFGVEDPMVLGLLATAGRSVFEPAALAAFAALQESVVQLEGIETHNVRSVINTDAIFGNDGNLEVEPIFDPAQPLASQQQLALQRFQQMPMLEGLLGRADGSALMMIVPVLDANNAELTYRQLHDLTEAHRLAGYELYIAGVAAMNARLDQTVTVDTRRLVPAAFITALAMVLLALRRPRALLGPVLVIAGATAIAIGILGWSGSRYYLITTALPVIVMAIAIADCLHIALNYSAVFQDDPGQTRRQALQRALARTLRPVTLTSWTTAAGFLGLGFGSTMVPIAEFGVFAAVGVLAAWVLSLTLLPAAMLWSRDQPRISVATQPAAQASPQRSRQPSLPQGTAPGLMGRLLQFSSTQPGLCIGLSLVLLTVMLGAASAVQFDYERARYFRSDDPVRIADRELNAALGGLNFLDVVVASPDGDSLLTRARLKHITELKDWLAEQPTVSHVSAIDDPIAVLHKALGSPAFRDPARAELAPQQYLFAYETASEPGDFDTQIDPRQTHLRIRAQLSTDSYQQTRTTVAALERKLTSWTSSTGLAAEPSGRVAVNRGWMQALETSHPRGLLLALALVTLTCCLWFRKGRSTAFSLIPVAFGVLAVYALMGGIGIDIAPATAMTSAIATGLGVDFGIHLASRLAQCQRLGIPVGEDPELAVIARACGYSALALSCALMTICISSAPPLRWFGVLIAVSAAGSLIGAIVLLPALAGWLNSNGSSRTPNQNESTNTSQS